MFTEKYSVVSQGSSYTSDSLLQVFRQARQHPQENVWSARIGTGLLGKPDCKAGRRGPNGKGEVLFGRGDSGLLGLVALGFIPCPVCQPEKMPGFEGVVSPPTETL